MILLYILFGILKQPENHSKHDELTVATNLE
jgi:hypothetical protein